MRLRFSNSSPAEIDEGVGCLRRAMDRLMEKEKIGQ